MNTRTYFQNHNQTEHNINDIYVMVLMDPNFDL